MSILKTLLEITEKGREYQSPNFADKSSLSVKPQEKVNAPTVAKRRSIKSAKPLRQDLPLNINNDPESTPLTRRLQTLGSIIGSAVAMHHAMSSKPSNAALARPGSTGEIIGPHIVDTSMFKELDKVASFHARELQIPRTVLLLFCAHFTEQLSEFCNITDPQVGETIGAKVGGKIAKELNIK